MKIKNLVYLAASIIITLFLVSLFGCATQGSFMGGPTKIDDGVQYQYVINSDINEYFWVSANRVRDKDAVVLQVKREFPEAVTLDGHGTKKVKVIIYDAVFHCDTHTRDIISAVYFDSKGTLLDFANIDDTNIPNPEPGVKLTVATIVEQMVCK